MQEKPLLHGANALLGFLAIITPTPPAALTVASAAHCGEAEDDISRHWDVIDSDSQTLQVTPFLSEGEPVSR